MIATAAWPGVFLTSTAVAWWALERPRWNRHGRLRRYARLDAPAADGAWARAHQRFEAWLVRHGIDGSPDGLLFLGLAYATMGALLGLRFGVPLLGIVLALGFWLARLAHARATRIARLTAQLPDAMLLLAAGLRAGQGLQQALQHAAREGLPPLSTELSRLERDMALGLEPEEALARLQGRLGSTDGEMLVTALALQRQTGCNLAETLTGLHQTVRDRQQVLAQVRTLTAQGRMSGVILCLLPIFVGAVLLVVAPGYLAPLLVDPRGQKLAIAAAVLMLIAVLMIARIVKIRF